VEIVVTVWALTSGTRAIRAVNPTVPIVFLGGGDPVGNGVVASLNHPGDRLGK
jgi:ABC-type uncharacterized transport system substrate-binding protein